MNFLFCWVAEGYLQDPGFGQKFREVTNISSCQVNTTSRQGIKQLGISFGSIFLLFSYKSRRGKSPAPAS